MDLVGAAITMVVAAGVLLVVVAVVGLVGRLLSRD
jgi:hypothetical protein